PPHLHGRRRGGVGAAHPGPALERGLRVLQARGRGARAGAGTEAPGPAGRTRLGLFDPHSRAEASARLVIAATMASPWKRPFSMKIRLVCLPDTSAPARKSPGTLVSSVAGSCCGT